MRTLAALLILCAAAEARADVWPYLRGPLTRHVQANIEENEGFYLIEDADQINAWMADFKSFDEKKVRRTRGGYIVSGLFAEKAAAGDSGGGGALLYVDFTLTKQGRRWSVVEEALRKVDDREFFSYNRAGERVWADPAEMLSVTIEREAPPPEEEPAAAFAGNEPSGQLRPQGEITGDRPSGKNEVYQEPPDDPRRKRYSGPGNKPSGRQQQGGAGANPFQNMDGRVDPAAGTGADNSGY